MRKHRPWPTTWRDIYSIFGGRSGFQIESDTSSIEGSKLCVTFTLDGKSVSHTFDMSTRWEKRYGPIPKDY